MGDVCGKFWVVGEHVGDALGFGGKAGDSFPSRGAVGVIPSGSFQGAVDLERAVGEVAARATCRGVSEPDLLQKPVVYQIAFHS